MKIQSNKIRTNFVAIISLVAWFAIFLQLYSIIVNRVVSIPETIVRFFSFFTIQSNILVAICFTFLWLKPKSKGGFFFLNHKNATAITLYITIVGIIYNMILRFLWSPAGLQRVADEVLHLVIPILVLVYWFLFVDKKLLVFKNILPWLIFPFLYLVYTLIRGHFFQFYPYPFLDVIQLGDKKVFVNSFFIVLVFLIVGFLLIGIGKISKNNKI